MAAFPTLRPMIQVGLDARDLPSARASLAPYGLTVTYADAGAQRATITWWLAFEGNAEPVEPTEVPATTRLALIAGAGDGLLALGEMGGYRRPGRRYHDAPSPRTVQARYLNELLAEAFEAADAQLESEEAAS